jgi:hypothetical protein
MDPNIPFRAVLAASSSITDLVGARIYAIRVPRDLAELDPQKCIVFQITGGSSDNETPVQQPTIDIRCYSPTSAGARALYDVVRTRLDALNNEVVTVSTKSYLCFDAVEQVDGWDEVDPDTDWAVVLSTWLFSAKEV